MNDNERFFETFESPWRLDTLHADLDRIEYIHSSDIKNRVRQIFQEFQSTVMNEKTFGSLRKGIY